MDKPSIPPEAKLPRDHAAFCAAADSGVCDSGGMTPWGSGIDVPCCLYEMEGKNIPHPVYWNPYNRVVQCHNCGHVYTPNKETDFGRSWREDSSLEKWFPLTAQELEKLKALNADKAKTIAAYCKAASWDKWKVERLVSAIDQYISSAGYNEATNLLTEARADVVNAKQNP